jgi:hypothetical protein
LGKALQTVPAKVASRELINILELRLLEANNVTRGARNHFMHSGLSVRIVEASNIPTEKVDVVTHWGY